MIVLDTSGLLAALDRAQEDHAAAAAALDLVEPPFFLSPFVLAELDYMLSSHVSAEARAAFLGEVVAGAYTLEPFSRADLADAERVIETYADLELSLADSSVVVLAHRHATHDLLTLDERDFRAVAALDGKPFRLLPADA